VAENRQRAVAGRAISHALGFQQILARHAKMPVAMMTVSATTFSTGRVA